MKIKTTFSAPMLAIVVMMLLVASRFIELDTLSYRENIFLAVIVLQLLVIVVPSAFYIKLKGSGFGSKLRLAPFSVEKLLVTLLATLTLILADMLLKLVLYQIGWIEDTYSIYYYYLNGAEPSVLYALVTFALLPSIAEELFFRSLLCAEYESSGVITAVIASAALYGMFGMNFGYFPVYFLAGLIFALVLYLTRSVFASMLCHLIYSVFDLAAGETVRTIITKPQSMAFLVFAIAGLLLLCLAALFGECERIFYGYALAGDRADYVNPKAGLRTFAEALLAPPFLVAILVFVVAAIQFG